MDTTFQKGSFVWQFYLYGLWPDFSSLVPVANGPEGDTQHIHNSKNIHGHRDLYTESAWLTSLFVLIISYTVFYLIIDSQKCTWHKSARMGEILNPCRNFKIFIAFVFPELSVCRDHLAVPGHKCQRESKNVVHTSWSLLDAHVEAFLVGVIPGKLNFEVTLGLICTFSRFVTPFCEIIFK